VGYWVDLNNRKEFFDSYARENNFDPLVPSNWYKLPSLNVFKIRKVCFSFKLAFFNIWRTFESTKFSFKKKKKKKKITGFGQHGNNFHRFYISVNDNHFFFPNSEKLKKKKNEGPRSLTQKI
jgi:hypothetical protein